MIDYGMDGKVALVTGAAGGIGRAAALTFARSGASVLVCDVSEAGGRETVALIAASGRGKAAFQHCDVSKADDVKAMVAAAVETFGRLDFAFNNAGINSIMANEYEDTLAGNSTLADGDFNGDGDFTTEDLVYAFSNGLYTG